MKNITNMKKIWMGGAIALVAVLAFGFGQQISLKQAELAAAAALRPAISPAGNISTPFRTLKVQRENVTGQMIVGPAKNSGSGEINVSPLGTVPCSDRSACNYKEGAKPGQGSVMYPEICHYAFFSEIDTSEDGYKSSWPRATDEILKKIRENPETEVSPQGAATSPLQLVGITTFSVQTPPGKAYNEKTWEFKVEGQGNEDKYIGTNACKSHAKFPPKKGTPNFVPGGLNKIQ